MEKLGNTTADLLHIYLSQVKKSVTVYIISGTGDTICHNNNSTGVIIIIIIIIIIITVLLAQVISLKSLIFFS
jgi:hypothetical protein